MVAKTCLLTNWIHGSKLTSDSELVNGYAPIIIDNPSKTLPNEIVESHKHNYALRALIKLLRSRKPRKLTLNDIYIVERVAYFYNYSKMNKITVWSDGKIEKIDDNIVEVGPGRKKIMKEYTTKN